MNNTFELHGQMPEIRALSDIEVLRLRALADAMIPARGDRPAGGGTLIDGGHLDRALRARPDLDAPLHAILGALDEDLLRREATSAIDLVATELPSEFDAFGKLLAGGYLMDPQVKDAIGYPGQEARSLGDDTSEYIEMLAEVVERGHTYRSAPAD